VDGTTTRDKKPRTFRIEKGRLSIAPSAEGPGQAIAVRRWGHVDLSSPEAAFAFGVPFFIGDVAFESPEVIRYTVTSNPAIDIQRAAARLELRREAEGIGGFLTTAEVIETPKPLRSQAQPQRREWRGGRYGDPSRTTLLSIVGGTPMGERCLLSNEVRLESLVTSAPALPGRK
jgi:hypothetical protein